MTWMQQTSKEDTKHTCNMSFHMCIIMSFHMCIITGTVRRTAIEYRIRIDERGDGP